MQMVISFQVLPNSLHGLKVRSAFGDVSVSVGGGGVFGGALIDAAAEQVAQRGE